MAELEKLLATTSRTFALSIPQLADPPRREVSVAYLLFRIADTFEDATRWPRSERLDALHDFADLVREPSLARAKELARAWLQAPPCDHQGYLELVRETPAVLAELEGFAPARRNAIVLHTLRTAEGMARFVQRADEAGNLRLHDVDDLKAYCYVVAGIVGELLTDLFVDAAPELRKVEQTLRAREKAFGEGLQLVNILKDADSDARDGRVYLPPDVPRSQVLELARNDLEDASEYVLALREAGAPRGMLGFTALPVLLARATLDEIEQHGPGSKVSRLTVASLVGKLMNDLDAGAPPLEVHAA
ncbi:MAG TPA: squalene/phytoene synthase family protein [Myxococcales bacterium]|jgi:farnesyl-diphosphate farnesyltransferase